MHPLIEDNRAAIEALCREFGIEKLEVFGSIMTDAFTDESDIDFIAHFPTDYDFGPWARKLFDLENRLGLLLGRRVDIVMTSALGNRWFRRAANQTRTELFDASKVTEVA